jgi:hypothetical protein
MYSRVHYSRVVIITPPPDEAEGFVKSTDEARNSTAAIGVIEAVVARFFTCGQQSLAMLLKIIL